MKIIISGGHLTPALSLIDYILARKKDTVVFIGREYSQTRYQQKSIERDEVEKRGVPFLDFDSGKLDLTNILLLPIQFLKFIQSFFQAMKILNSQKPNVFVSFGGYLAVPIALAAWFNRIPIVTHEQTAAAGTANRFIAVLARKVAISFPETTASFPKQKVILTGNPIRQQLWQKTPAQPAWAMPTSQRPLLYITGGSQGSQSINLLIKHVLPQILAEWDVIHQCGKSNSLMNYLAELELAKKLLPKNLQNQYQAREWVSEQELAWIYKHAWAMISRAGANTVQEVIYAKIPTIFVPLAHARHNEQSKNAMSLVQKNAAIYLSQKDLDAKHLLSALNDLKRNHSSLRNSLTQMKQNFPLNADEQLYQVVLEASHEK